MSIAIDIGTRALHLVQGKATKNNVVIKQAIIEVLPSGLIQDGIIREFGGMEMALRNMLSKYKIKDNSCSLTVYGSHIYNRELDVPNSKTKVVDDIVTFEVQSSMSTGKDAAVEYVKSRHVNLDKPDQLHIRASAMQMEYISDYYKLLKNCHLRPVALDVHPNAVSKAIAYSDINGRPQKENGSLMLIDIGAVNTIVYIFSKGEMIYFRVIPAGGIEIERYISSINEEAPASEQIDNEELVLSLDNLRSDENLANAVRPLVTTINDGVKRIQQFIAGKIPNGRLEQVYLIGRTAVYQGFDRTLGEAFDIPTETVRSIDKIKMPADQLLAPFVNAVGALIRNSD